jgi:hypothetical protein
MLSTADSRSSIHPNSITHVVETFPLLNLPITRDVERPLVIGSCNGQNLYIVEEQILNTHIQNRDTIKALLKQIQQEQGNCDSLKKQIEVLVARNESLEQQMLVLSDGFKELQIKETARCCAEKSKKAKMVMGEIGHLFKKWILLVVTGNTKESWDDFNSRDLSEDESNKWTILKEKMIKVCGSVTYTELSNLVQELADERGEAVHSGYKEDLPRAEFDELLKVSVQNSTSPDVAWQPGKALLDLLFSELNGTPFGLSKV